MSNLKSLKRQLRQQMQTLLQEKAGAIAPEAAQQMRDLFLKRFSSLPREKIVAGTIPIRNEIDPAPLMEALAKKGHPLCLPVVMGKGQPLIFRSYKPGDTLEEKIWGLREPPESSVEIVPDVVLCPLLAFDRLGHRLGYGAGYYDLTLRELRRTGKILTVGLAFALQEVKNIPAGNLDQRLDAIVTEKEVILPSSGQA